MSKSEKVDVGSLPLISTKPAAEQYVFLWLMAIFEAGGIRWTFRRSGPLPCLSEIGAHKDLVEAAPPPTSVAFDDVLKRLKVMANLAPVAYTGLMEADIELNISGQDAVAHLRFDEGADDPWCEVTMARLES